MRTHLLGFHFFVLLFSILGLQFSVPVWSQALDPKTLEVAAILAPVHTLGAVEQRLLTFPPGAQPDPLPLLRDAWKSTRIALAGRNCDPGPDDNNARFLDLAVKLLTTAALLSNADERRRLPDSYPLDVLVSSDVDALHDEFSYPNKDDLVRFLLERRPHLSDIRIRGEYSAIAAFEDKKGQRLNALIESVKPNGFPLFRRDHKSISASGELRFLPEQLKSYRHEGVAQRTRRFNLLALPPLILVSKAVQLRGAFLHDPAALAWVDAVINEAFSEITLYEDPVYANIGIFAAMRARDSVVHYKALIDRSALFDQMLESRLATTLPVALYRSGNFDGALTEYGHLVDGGYDRAAQLTGLWGQAISALALGDSPRGCAALTDYFTNDKDPDWRRTLFADLLLNALPAIELSRCGASGKRLRAATAILLAGRSSTERFGQLCVLTDGLMFMRRPRIGARIAMRCIREVRQEGGTAAVRQEITCLRELAAYLREVYGKISFSRFSALDGRWLHHTDVAMTDFPHNRRCATRSKIVRGDEPLDSLVCNDTAPLSYAQPLTESGEVVLTQTFQPYGAQEPEEDLATTGVAYGLDDESVCPTPTDATQSWVINSMQLDPPSFGPLTKAVYLEWFGNRFDSLKSPMMSSDNFEYRPCRELSVTELRAVLDQVEKGVLPARYEELLKFFVSTRRFLEGHYGTVESSKN